MTNRPLLAVLAVFLLLACVFGSARLDIDEFRVIKEPYEMLGGDYTIAYLKRSQVVRALDCAWRSYTFYWHYRPLAAPIISDVDKARFVTEERTFGYVQPQSSDTSSASTYRQRLIVPEPDRFYRHGAGAPLFTAVVRMPSLVLTQMITRLGFDLLGLQFSVNYHPLFIVPRLQGILAGLATILLLFLVLDAELPRGAALAGAAWLAMLPPSLMFFPNLHYDAILAPFVLATAWFFVNRRYVPAGVCFGLALASKNTAVMLLPAMVGFIGIEWARSRWGGAASAEAESVKRRAVGLCALLVTGTLVLLPFANPVSQAREVLTPLFPNRHDPRGEDFERFSLVQQNRPADATGPARIERPGVILVKRALGYSYLSLFALLAVPLLWGRLSAAIARFALAFVLTALPYSLVFGPSLGYRSLMYLPFFCILAAHALSRRAVSLLLAVTTAVSLFFALDPVTATGMPYSTRIEQTLMDAITGR